jgi:ribonuclease HI
MKWWASLGTNPYVGRAIWSHPTATVFTDASMGGWGAVWDGRVPAAGFFSEREEGAHINELELTAALNALRAFLPFARKRHVQLVTDSPVTAHVVRNYTSRSPRLLAKLRTLRALCEEHGVTLSTRHLPSVLNCWADRLSRRRDSLHWELPDIARRLLELRTQRKLRTVDGHDLPDYAPLHNAVVLPRPALLGVWARHLATAGAGVMVAPLWPRQSWFNAAQRRARPEPGPALPDGRSLTPPWPSVVFNFNTMPHCGGRLRAGRPPSRF